MHTVLSPTLVPRVYRVVSLLGTLLVILFCLVTFNSQARTSAKEAPDAHAGHVAMSQGSTVPCHAESIASAVVDEVGDCEDCSQGGACAPVCTCAHTCVGAGAAAALPPQPFRLALQTRDWGLLVSESVPGRPLSLELPPPRG